MRIRVDQIDGDSLKALIEHGSPIEGRYYELEDTTTGSSAQNKAFHALCKAWWEWMFSNGCLEFEFNGTIFNFETPDWLAFKDLWKARYGAGATHLEYVDQFYSMQKIDDIKNVPAYAKADFDGGNRGRIKQVLKSWSKYTKGERTKTIQLMLNIIPCSGCDDPKVMEIMDGMQKDFGFKRIGA